MKKKKNPRLLAALVILFLLAILFGVAATRKITKVEYKGLQNCSEEEMNHVLFQEKIDKNPFVFWIKKTFKEPVTIPFVEEYSIKMKSLHEVEVTVYEKTIIGYLQYMGECMYFDKDGIVVEVTQTQLEGITWVTGISFDHIVINEKIPVKDEDTFQAILDITQLLANHELQVDTIKMDEDLNMTLLIGQVRVELGEDDDTLSGKINDLDSICNNLEDIPGVLDMKEYSTNDKGYTFKKDK